MIVKVEKQPKATVKIDISVPNDKVKQTYDELFKQVVAEAEIKGFRKGQAPVDVVKEKTDVSKLYGEIINKLLQTYYPQALKENHIAPVSNPKVEIQEFDLEKDFEFSAVVAVRPEVKIGDYKKQIEKAHEKRAKEQRELNAEKLKNGEQIEHDHVHISADDVVNALVDNSEVEISDVLIEDETDRMMTRLVNQAQAVGISLEQYLKSQNKTAEDLRKEYDVISEKNLAAEFILAELIKKENVTVSDKEVEDMITASGDPETAKELQDPVQKMYIKSILEKNKVITNIIKELEEEEK